MPGISKLTHGFPQVFHRRKAWIDFVETVYSQPTSGHHFADDAFAEQFTAPLFESELGYRPSRRLLEDSVPSGIPLTFINVKKNLNAA